MCDCLNQTAVASNYIDTYIRVSRIGTFVAYYKKQWSEWKNRSKINHKIEQSAINQSDVEQSVTNQSDIEQSVTNQNTI